MGKGAHKVRPYVEPDDGAPDRSPGVGEGAHKVRPYVEPDDGELDKLQSAVIDRRYGSETAQKPAPKIGLRWWSALTPPRRASPTR